MGCKYPVIAKATWLAVLPALLSLAGPAGAASADTCSLKLLNSVPLTIANSIASVPASVGTQEKEFEIGTSAPDNQMGKDAMTDFGLKAINFTPIQNNSSAGAFSLGTAALTDIDGTARGRSFGSMIGGGASDNTIPIYDAHGRMFHSMAEADHFTLGSMQTDHLQFVVTDLPQPGSGGILSAGFFRKYDIDLNFAARRFNMFAPGHCEGRVVYWRAPGVARLPFRFKNGRIIVRVTVDGREMDAAIDTGSPRSELQFDDPDSFFYLNSKSAGVMREADGNLGHDFGVMSFNGVAITHPHLVLTHAAAMGGMDSGAQTGTLLRNVGNTSMQPALTIGTDLLRLLHVYIAFNERMIYVTQGAELPEGDARAMPVVAVTPSRP